MQSFKLIAQTLGECIVSRPDVRLDVLSALRKVLLHTVDGQYRAYSCKDKFEELSTKHSASVCNLLTHLNL